MEKDGAGVSGGASGHAERSMSLEAFEAFLAVLTPQACTSVLDWLVLPWTLGELLEGEPHGEAVLQELMNLGVVRFVNGCAELYACDWKGW